MATVRFALVGVCNISEEHAPLSGPPHHRDTLGKERVLILSTILTEKGLDKNMKIKSELTGNRVLDCLKLKKILTVGEPSLPRLQSQFPSNVPANSSCLR